MEQFSEQNNVRYINGYAIMDEIGIDCNTDFSDDAHLNRSGAKKYADYLGRIIVENYDFPCI